MTLDNMCKWFLLKYFPNALVLRQFFFTAVVNGLYTSYVWIFFFVWTTQNIMLWISACFTFRTIALRTNAPTSHHVRAQQATPTTINNNSWQAPYLCLSVPISAYKQDVTYTGFSNHYPVIHLEVYAKLPLSFSWKENPLSDKNL